jgi:hypothetical protein
MTPPANHPITTTGTTSTVSTTKNSGESVSDWVERHDNAVANATPNGDSLTTTYTSANGSESKTTTRLPNETDAAFLARHVTDYLEKMVSTPPIP